MYNEEQLKESAYHEAGHAVVFQIYCCFCDEVSIADIGRKKLGSCMNTGYYLYSLIDIKKLRKQKEYEFYKQGAPLHSNLFMAHRIGF